MLNNLQAEQARHRMTNQQVADYLKISRPCYEQKKKSRRFVVSECLALCKLFKCKFEYLFADESDNHPHDNRIA